MRPTLRKLFEIFTAAALATAAAPAWAQSFSLESLLMPGPVTASHAHVEQDCRSCHSGEGAAQQDALCGTCHSAVIEDRAASAGFHGRDRTAVSRNCADCHEEHDGRDANAVNFDPARFDHRLTDFPLHGAHRGVECAQCHAPELSYREALDECAACHAQNDVHMGALGSACSNCHDAAGWMDVHFDHRETGFPLLGMHTRTSCSDCHENQAFANTPSTCIGCHADDDAHALRFGTDCGQCHSYSGWAMSSFDHAGTSRFPLLGAHGELGCVACHTNDLTTALPSSCEGCHANDDPHRGNFGGDCASCHTVTNWGTASFDHFTATEFELLGSHASLSCIQCHTDAAVTALPTNCLGCHESDPHAGQLGEDCAVCHGQASWTDDVLFDHGLSSFPLIGAHAALECTACHSTLAFHDTSQACADCHTDDDVHAAGFGEDCAVCHNPVAWRSSNFDHAAVADFPLTGAHAALDCACCHRQPLDAMATSARTCASCHRHDDAHNGAFGTGCGQCHTTEEF